MIYAALAALVMTLLVNIGRRPWFGRKHWRLLTVVLAAASAGGAIFVAARGAWVDGLILLASAVWLALCGRARENRPDATMDLAEARATLGVSQAAGRDEIEAAYRRLMRRVHPDLGGAPGLAVRLNAARDRLLRTVG